jgi:hypothetical protein
LGLTDEETVLQIQENAYMQLFLGYCQATSAFGPPATGKLAHLTAN